MRQDSGPCNFSDIRENDLPHIYRALCGDPTMVPIRKGTKMKVDTAELAHSHQNRIRCSCGALLLVAAFCLWLLCKSFLETKFQC